MEKTAWCTRVLATAATLVIGAGGLEGQGVSFEEEIVEGRTIQRESRAATRIACCFRSIRVSSPMCPWSRKTSIWRSC